jgi:glyoxylase-like metal-dependent hydrolase (beta-lactamase superfamily II)
MELNWAVEQPWGVTPVPELYVRELQGWPTLHAARDGEELLPAVTSYLSPGHTPGSLIYLLRGSHHDLIFTGDAAKNRAELVSGVPDMTSDLSLSTASIQTIWDLWSRRPGTVLVPGHDMPMVLENGVARYIQKREAAINAWFGDDLKVTKGFQLA